MRVKITYDLNAEKCLSQMLQWWHDVDSDQHSYCLQEEFDGDGSQMCEKVCLN